MITTRRNDSYESSVYEQSSSSGIALLERRMPAQENSYAVHSAPEQEAPEQARERMQRNLDRLLHYDKYANEQEPVEMQAPEILEAKTEEPVNYSVQAEAPAVTPVVAQEDDIRPTSTTMQFGDGQTDGVYNDMNKYKEGERAGFHLNSKGKIVVALYALAVTVIMALIILNTGLLASLKSTNAAIQADVNAKMTEYAEITEQIEYNSSNEYVEDWAINNGMIKR